MVSFKPVKCKDNPNEGSARNQECKVEYDDNHDDSDEDESIPPEEWKNGIVPSSQNRRLRWCRGSKQGAEHSIRGKAKDLLRPVAKRFLSGLNIAQEKRQLIHLPVTSRVFIDKES